MREKTKRQMLSVLTGDAYEPNDSHRRMLLQLKLNDVPHDRIAAALGISRATLEYYYAKELDYGVEAVLAMTADRMLYLSQQNIDFGVALRASQAILQPRVKSWREPHVDAINGIGDISDRTLEQVEADIERLERQLRTAAQAQEAAAGTDPDQAEPA